MLSARVRLLAAVNILMLLGACNTDPRLVSRKYVDSGNQYFRTGKFREASILYRRALAKDMRYADAWYRLGLANLKLGAAGEARRNFSRAMDIDPQNIDAIVKLGDLDLVFYSVSPQGNRAVLADLQDLVQQLFKKDPKSFEGLRFAGHIALLQKDRKTAIQKFERANQVKPDQPELVLPLVETLFADQQNEAAEELAVQLIDKRKDFGPIYDALYYRYLVTNRIELGEELLKKRVAGNPGQAAGLVQLAHHYRMTGRPQEMAAVLERLKNRMLVGDFYERIRELDRAYAQYDLGQRENPNSGRAYRKKMAEILGTQGRRDEASKMVDALLKEDSKDPEAIAIHATLLLASGGKAQVQTAIDELQPLVLKTPGNATLHLNLGRAYMASGDALSIEQARTQFLEALKIDARYVPARVALGQLQLARGEAAQAVQNADEALKADPANVAARLIRGTGLTQMQENQKAREELTTVLKMDPESGEARFQLGKLNYLERHYGDAEADFKILLDSKDPRGLPGIIEVKAAQGQWSQAVQVVEGQVRRSPERMDYRAELAKTYFRAGKFADAAREFQKLIDARPGAAALYVGLGDAKKSGGDTGGAIAAFDKAKALEPRNVVAHLGLAMTYEQTGRDAEARKAYQDAIDIQPDNVEALNNLAYLEADGGVDLDQALAHAKQAQQKRPNDPNVMDTVALIYIRKNLTDDSVRLLRDLTRRTPENPTFHLHLAMALYQKGDRQMAKRELEAAIRNKPSGREQTKIKQMLAKLG